MMMRPSLPIRRQSFQFLGSRQASTHVTARLPQVQVRHIAVPVQCRNGIRALPPSHPRLTTPSYAPFLHQQRSTVTSTAVEAEPLEGPYMVLKPANLFHPMDQSPLPSMRERADYIKAHAYCPHPDHMRTRPVHISFTCPDCGTPTYCTEQHWAEDYENHLRICDTLREVNEDDHDLRSGRFFPEFDYPGVQLNEALINFTNWDTYLYTRGFEAVNEERNLRQLTKLLTYPTTIASVLHELSPYNLKHRLTVEGLKSLAGVSSSHTHSPLINYHNPIEFPRLCLSDFILPPLCYPNQLYATTSTPPSLALGKLSRGCAYSPLPPVSSSSEHGPSPRYPEKYGINSAIYFPRPFSTSFSSGLSLC